MSEEHTGRVFVLRGDIRRLSCTAWALPCDGQGRLEPSWVAWPPGAARRVQQPEPFPHWTVEARRVRPLEGWPSNLPRPWLLHVELDPSIPRSWLVEAVVDYVEAAAAAARPTDRATASAATRSLPLLAVPLGVAGIGAADGQGARRAAGGLARELLPELQQAAREHRVDVALVAHSDDSLAACQAARQALDGGADPAPPPLPRSLADGLQPVRDAAREGRLAALVGPALARRDGVPAWPELLEQLADELDLAQPWRQALRMADQTEHSRALARHLGGTGALARAAAEHLARAHASLAHHLLAGLEPDPVLSLGPDDLLEQAWASAGRPLDVLHDGPTTPGGPRLFKRHGSLRRPRGMVEARVDRARRQERDQLLRLAAQASLRPDSHLLVLGFAPGGALVELLGQLLPLLPADARSGPRITVLAERDDPAFADLWPGDQLRWLPLLTHDDASPAQVGRRLELVLDQLGRQRGTAGRALDPALRPLLDEGDQALGRAVDELMRRLPSKARSAELWPELHRWLRARGLQES